MKDRIFDTLLTISDVSDLVDTLECKFQSVKEYFYSPYSQQEEQRDSLERFVLFKHRLLNELDYSVIQNRSFILMLLDLSERHAAYSCIPHLVNIILLNDININSRMEAGLRFTYPKPKTNDEIVGKLSEICTLLEKAYQHEEDDEKNIQIVLLNYFDHVLYNTNSTYSQQLLTDFLWIQDKFNFVKGLEFLNGLKSTDGEKAHDEIQSFIAELYHGNMSNQEYSVEDFIIEDNTEYSEAIHSIPTDFGSIRQYSVNHANGELCGRGVSMLSSEEEMFEYMKRFGRMHYAKLESAFTSPFPQHFDGKVNIIDWGCGQALATMAFIEKYGDNCINQITLIEPSEIVLKRAALHSRKFAPNAKIMTINKKIDDLTADDFHVNLSTPTIHLFSNILDINDYHPRLLFSLVDTISSSGDYFVCVSPYIDDIKTERIISFLNYFKIKDTFALYHEKYNSKISDFWMCNNTYKKVFSGHGKYLNCISPDENGCPNKWTRVLIVFSI